MICHVLFPIVIGGGDLKYARWFSQDVTLNTANPLDLIWYCTLNYPIVGKVLFFVRPSVCLSFRLAVTSKDSEMESMRCFGPSQNVFRI